MFKKIIFTLITVLAFTTSAYAKLPDITGRVQDVALPHLNVVATLLSLQPKEDVVMIEVTGNGGQCIAKAVEGFDSFPIRGRRNHVYQMVLHTETAYRCNVFSIEILTIHGVVELELQ